MLGLLHRDTGVGHHETKLQQMEQQGKLYVLQDVDLGSVVLPGEHKRTACVH